MHESEIDPEKRMQMLETAALQGSQTVAGIAMRPMNWTSYSLFNRMKEGASAASELSFNVMLFAFLHSASEEVLRASVAKPESLFPKVFDFMNGIGPVQYREIEQWALSEIQTFEASTTATEALLPQGDADPKA